jgi:hypothetical protein
LEYSGNGGPGTFEMVTLNSGRCRSAMRVREYSRAARPASAGAANSIQSVSVAAPMTFSCSLACCVPSWIAWRRLIGSSIWVAS